jgi:hypothetical protein
VPLMFTLLFLGLDWHDLDAAGRSPLHREVGAEAPRDPGTALGVELFEHRMVGFFISRYPSDPSLARCDHPVPNQSAQIDSIAPLSSR